MRPPGLIVYAIAFAIGLLISPMLSRYILGAGNALPAVPYTQAVPSPVRVGPRVRPTASTPRAVETARRPGPKTSQSVAPRSGPPEPPRPSAPTSRASSLPVAPLRQSAPPPVVPQPSSPAAPPAPGPATPSAEQPLTIAVTPDDVAPSGPNQASAEGQRFHVQVGAFSTREAAVALVQRLQTLGYVATLAEGDVYRVWVGGYFDRETATRLADTVRKAGFEVEIVP